MAGARDRERWVVESIGDATANVEVDGTEMRRVPRWLLPTDARAGDVLAVSHARGADRTTVTVERDAAATKQALAESERQVRDAPVDRTGGDVTL